MNNTPSGLASFSLFSPGVLATSTQRGAVDVHPKNSNNYSSMEQVADGGAGVREESDIAMDTSSSSQTPELSRSESAASPNDPQTSNSSQPTLTVSFPKPPAKFSSNLIPPTPPMTTPPKDSNPVAASSSLCRQQTRQRVFEAGLDGGRACVCGAMGTLFVELSAKTKVGVQDTFRELVEKIGDTPYSRDSSFPTYRLTG
ncbi:hypothetical protein FRC08_010890 [Ceratobasidium sp. 394]|nr:hypothetical protein FRC08_010890 [Ceratobasidium sp. 394]KAG9096155.1 hypothetical protein FS749_009026 [Ceratobasidium sp. UAMH 11750]